MDTIKEKIKQKMKRKLRETERERSNIFCVRKLYIEWKRKCQIYNKMLRIRIVKNKKKIKKRKIKGQRENDIKVESSEKMKR